jgi:anti-sigma B factor antagonist
VVTGPPAPALTIELVTAPGTVTVVIGGDLDLVTAPLLSRHLAPALDDGPQRLVFDMAGVEFIDCAALRLIASTRRCLPAGRQPVIRHPNAAVRRMLRLTGLAANCEVDPSGELPE